MPKYDAIVIGDSLAAIHLALELARSDVSVLVVRPDSFPVEICETEAGSFDCDLASGCDLSYYASGDKAGDLYGFAKGFELHPFPFHLKGPSFSIDEPSEDFDFQIDFAKSFPAHRSCLMAFLTQLKFIHELADEIETKTGTGSCFKDVKDAVFLSHLPPWTYKHVKRLTSMSFCTFLSQFNLPSEFEKLYEVMCHDICGLGPDSIDALTGAEMITRRYHGLSRPSCGWISLKDAMLARFRGRSGADIIGGHKIDMIKSSAGIVYQVLIDERGEYTTDWLIVDETISLLAKQFIGAGGEKFIPLGFHSYSHASFRMLLGWKTKPPYAWPVGVNYYYNDMRFPPQAPHFLRLDVVPPVQDDEYGFPTRLTVRGNYPWERLVTSWGDRISLDEISSEIISSVSKALDFPSSEPDFARLVLPEKFYDPYSSDNHTKETLTPARFAMEHQNVRVIPSSGINGGNIRLAFRAAERIAKEIQHKIELKKKIWDIVVAPIEGSPSYKRILNADLEEVGK